MSRETKATTEINEKLQKTLNEKLVEIMSSVEYIPKRGHNERQGYDYALESDIKSVVRKQLADHNILLVPNEKSRTVLETHTKSGASQLLVSLEIEYTLFDADNSTQIVMTAFGDGIDSGDKAVYKAKTGALKNLLTNLFLIPTGDDPEMDGQALQPEYITQEKVDYLNRKIDETSKIGNADRQAVANEMMRNTGIKKEFSKYTMQEFQKSSELLISWIKNFELEAQRKRQQQPNFSNSTPQNNNQNIPWGQR